MNKKWSNTDIDFICKHYPKKGSKWVAERLNFTKTAVKSKAYILGLKRDEGFRKAVKVWTPGKVKLLKNLYPNKFNYEIAKTLNVSLRAVKSQAYKLKLTKTNEFMQLHGGRFNKGHTPVNKGKKMSQEIREKVKHTFFKKGHTPANHKPLGSERINVDGYIEIKIAEPNIWDLKHRVVWREINGEIHQGYNIQFKDKNRQNCDIDNLYIIHRKLQIRKNSILNYPPELRKTFRYLGKLNRIIIDKTKNDETN